MYDFFAPGNTKWSHLRMFPKSFGSEYENISVDSGNISMLNFCYALDMPNTAKVIYGYGVPIMSLFTLFLNSLAITIFMTTNRRSPTNIILTALALSDLLAICIAAPMLFIVYGLENKEHIMKYPFCIYHDFAYYLASMFHILSIWLTTLLGLQRYIVVAFPLNGPRLWTRRNSYLGILILFLLSLTVNVVPYFWRRKYGFVTLYEHISGDRHADICLCTNTQSAEGISTAVTYLKNFIGTTIPCITIVSTTILLIFELKKNTKQIMSLHSEEHVSERRDLKHIERTSKTIIAIAVCFLIMELPFVIIYTWILIEPYPDNSFLSSDTRYYLAMFSNFIVYGGSMANFFIFMSMSENFRRKLKSILLFGWPFNYVLKSEGHNHHTIAIHNSMHNVNTYHSVVYSVHSVHIVHNIHH